MPIYEFTCPLGHKFEKVVKLGTDKAFCDECNKDGLMSEADRIISKPAPAHFSGQGWTPRRLERKG